MYKLTMGALVAFLLSGCINTQPEKNTDKKTETPAAPSTPSRDIGVGPITEVMITESIDQEMATKGQVIFEAKCSACHKTDKRFVGPAIAGVTERREPEWIMNMILNPDIMVKENETAKNLLMEYSAPMANQNLTETEAREVLEYFRTLAISSEEPVTTK